jgi:hypothetical protein
VNLLLLTPCNLSWKDFFSISLCLIF